MNAQNANAFAGSTGITINAGSALQLQGGITIAQPLTLFGGGIYNDGAIRSVSDGNTYSGFITNLNNVTGPYARINSDTGLFTLSGTISNVNAGGQNLYLGGAGNILVSGRITGAGGILKDGTGTVRLTGTNTFTGAANINSGTLTLDFGATGAPSTNIIAGTALYFGNTTGNIICGGVLQVISGTSGINSQTFSGTTINNGYNAIIATNNPGGSIVVNLGGITRNTGNGVVDFTLPGSGKLTTTTACQIDLPVARPDRRLRWNLNALYDALDASPSGRTHLDGIGRTVDYARSQLTGIQTARFATGMSLAMRITQWLGRPAADFVRAARW